MLSERKVDSFEIKARRWDIDETVQHSKWWKLESGNFGADLLCILFLERLGILERRFVWG